MSSPVVHTKDQILHPGARQDFEQHICRLIEEGKRDEALSLWQAVAEVHHLPPTEGPRVQGHDPPSHGHDGLHSSRLSALRAGTRRFSVSLARSVGSPRCSGPHGH